MKTLFYYLLSFTRLLIYFTSSLALVGGLSQPAAAHNGASYDAADFVGGVSHLSEAGIAVHHFAHPHFHSHRWIVRATGTSHPDFRHPHERVPVGPNLHVAVTAPVEPTGFRIDADVMTAAGWSYYELPEDELLRNGSEGDALPRPPEHARLQPTGLLIEPLVARKDLRFG
ncbi:MAG: hypothetical protein AAF682_04745 [Planctomycetota bacterium]